LIGQTRWVLIILAQPPRNSLADPTSETGVLPKRDSRTPWSPRGEQCPPFLEADFLGAQLPWAELNVAFLSEQGVVPGTPGGPFALWTHLRSSSQDRQNQAFHGLLKASDSPVDWGYEEWDDLLRTLVDGDNRQRAIAAQVLSNLAKSDPKERMIRDLSVLLGVTKDERFVTARHCLQSLWKVGAAGEPPRKALLKGLAVRFRECAAEKNCTLIRYDILVVLRRVYDVVNEDEHFRSIAERLIASRGGRQVPEVVCHRVAQMNPTPWTRGKRRSVDLFSVGVAGNPECWMASHLRVG